MRIAATVIVIALIAAGAWAAQQQPDLKGFRIGMSEGDILTALPSAKCFWPKTTVFSDRVCIDLKNSIAGHPARLLVSFMGERTMRIDFSFACDHGIDVAEALAQKFGRAAEFINSTEKVGEYPQTIAIATWRFDGESVQLRIPQTGDAMLSLIDLTVMEEITRRRAREKERRAKDL